MCRHRSTCSATVASRQAIEISCGASRLRDSKSMAAVNPSLTGARTNAQQTTTPSNRARSDFNVAPSVDANSNQAANDNQTCIDAIPDRLRHLQARSRTAVICGLG